MAGEVTADEVNGIVLQLTELVADLTEAAKAIHNASQYEMAQWAVERGNFREDTHYRVQQLSQAHKVRGMGRLVDAMTGVVLGAALMWGLLSW
jgi:hypothetical protein